MPMAKTLKSKVCLVGENAVGKSSLIARFVTDRFDPRYTMTIGTKVVKKSVVVHVDARDADVSVEMTIWDIMGEKGFRQLLKEAYFYGTDGIVAVCDLTRRSTLEDLDDWADHILRSVGPVPMIVAVNKSDLADEAKFGDHEVSAFLSAYKASHVFTSAKTGQNVEGAFGSLARAMVHRQLGWPTDAAARTDGPATANADPASA